MKMKKALQKQGLYEKKTNPSVCFADTSLYTREAKLIRDYMMFVLAGLWCGTGFVCSARASALPR